MKRSILPGLLAGTMLVSGCGGVSGGADQASSMPPQPVVAAPVTAVEPLPAAAPQPEPPKPKPKPVVPQIKWHQQGIGLPLVSEDPAAKDMKVAMLSFDDGPTPQGHTEKILDVLKEQNVKAVFFITGLGLKNRHLVERIHQEGHVLAPHSVTHANLTKLTVPEMKQEIEPLVTLIESVTGAKPKYFRPPYGAYNKELQAMLKEYGMELVNWTNGSLDWEGVDANGYKDPQKVVADVMRQLHKGAIILMHDTKKHTAEALPELIRQVRGAGYDFVVLQ